MSNLKNYLYVLNIFLLTIFLLGMLGLKICVVKLASLPNKDNNNNSSLTTKASINIALKTDVPISQIYGKRDIFGLFIEDNTPQQQKDLSMNNIPTLTIPEIQPIETEKSTAFIDPLPISLNAIIISTDTDSSVCIIADETDKEVIYHVGDRIKDGVIIKLMRDRIMILRLNGQIETYFLHNDALDLPKDPIESISKNNDGIFEIDKNKFLASIPNAGAFLDFFEAVPFVDEETNTVLGFVVTDKNVNGFAYKLGFEQFDLITTIDGFEFDTNKKRLLAYENIITKSSQNGFSFKVEFERDGKKMTNHYQVINTAERFLPKESSNSLKATYELINKQPSERRQTAQQLFSASQKQQPHNDEIKYLQSDEEKRFLENLAQIREEMLAKNNINLAPKEN